MFATALVFSLLSLFSLIMIIISLFTPRTAWFAKNKTKVKAILTWLGIAVFSFFIVGLTAPTDESKPRHMDANRQIQLSQPISETQAPAQTEQPSQPATTESQAIKNDASQMANFEKEIKKFDSQITHVQLMNNDGQNVLIIQYRAGVVPDPLLTESESLMNIARKVAESKNYERLTALQFVFMIPAVDKYNNKMDAEGLQLFWSMDNLKKINWKGFRNWQFLNLVDGVALGPMGPGVIKDYCEQGHSYSDGFCHKALNR